MAGDAGYEVQGDGARGFAVICGNAQAFGAVEAELGFARSSDVEWRGGKALAVDVVEFAHGRFGFLMFWFWWFAVCGGSRCGCGA